MLLFLVLATSAQAQATPPDLPTYEGWLREAAAAAQRNDRIGFEQAANRLVETQQVRLNDGTLLPVDNAWLRPLLADAERSMPQAAEQLGALLDALAQPPPSAPDDAEQRLRDLLSRPPFSEEQDSSLLGQILDWLWAFLERLLSPFGQVGEGPRAAFGWLIGVLAVLLVLGVLLYWLFSMRRTLAREARSEEHDPEAGLTSQTAMQQAGSVAEGGDYRTAVRFLYLSALLWLDEKGLLRYDRALTNREYLERLRDNAGLRAQLLPIVETFDQVWYGHVTLDADGFAAYRRQVEGLRRGKGR
ncbi:MAG: DUF4129 domain-containing protein [Chloroflexaceae bacterium]|nr:DUF4129 domain-containing protein [Chloroflexaceae bacterium]